MYNRPEDREVLHGTQMPNGALKVLVDVATVPNARLPYPNPDAEMETVGDAVGSFVAWPVVLVAIDSAV